MQELIDEMLGLHVKRNVDRWEKSKMIPLLMRRRYHMYETGEIPLDDTVVLDLKPYIDRNNPLHMLMVGKTGRQKTRMVKNIIKGLYKVGYKILMFEPKALEMLYANRKGKGIRLAQDDKNETMPVVSYTPSALREYAKRVLPPEDFRKLRFYSIDIKTLDNREVWLSYGVADKAASIVIQAIQDGNTDLEKIKNIIKRADMMASTKTASIAAIESLIAQRVFDKRFKPLPIEEEWERGNIITINYINKPGKLMNTDVGLVTAMVKDIGMKEGKSVTKKMLVYDDAFFYAGAMAYELAQSRISYAVNEMGNVQYNYRKFGMDSIVIIQNLDKASIVPTLVEGREDFLITKTGSSEKLRDLIPYGAYLLATNTNPMKGRMLVTKKQDYYFEWIYCNADGEYATGFPFDCTVGHPSK